MMEVGKKVPEFQLEIKPKEYVNLESFRGKYLILYFYPKDQTPGCTLEATTFSLYIKEFEDLNASVVGVSKDSCGSHEKFITKNNLAVTLLSDPSLETAKQFGAVGEKSMYGKKYTGVIRSTFLIDPQGNLCKEYRNVKVKGHVETVLADLKELVNRE